MVNGGIMFLGDYNHNLDDKGRVFLPAKFRAELGKTIVITKGFDNCLYIFRLKLGLSLPKV